MIPAILLLASVPPIAASHGEMVEVHGTGRAGEQSDPVRTPPREAVRLLQTERAETPIHVDAAGEVICRRRAVIGSLVRTAKECHDRREWARLDEDVRKQAGEYADHGRGGT